MMANVYTCNISAGWMTSHTLSKEMTEILEKYVVDSQINLLSDILRHVEITLGVIAIVSWLSRLSLKSAPVNLSEGRFSGIEID